MVSYPFKSRLGNEGKADDAGEETHEPEDRDDLPFRPAAELEVVMNRAHAEDALARRLERDDLDDDGERFADKDEADDDEQELRVRQDADGRERAAEREAARVAHEDFRGVRIEAQEAEASRGTV